MRDLNKQVYFLNEVNRLRDLLVLNLPSQIKPFLNQKILKADGGLTKKFSSSIEYPEFKPTPLNGGFASLQYCYISGDSYSLTVKISLCFHGGSYDDKTYYCQYVSDTIYLAGMSQQSLKELYTLKTRIPIDADKELIKIKKFKELTKQAEKIKETILVDSELYKYL